MSRCRLSWMKPGRATRTWLQSWRQRARHAPYPVSGLPPSLFGLLLGPPHLLGHLPASGHSGAVKLGLPPPRMCMMAV